MPFPLPIPPPSSRLRVVRLAPAFSPPTRPPSPQGFPQGIPHLTHGSHAALERGGPTRRPLSETSQGGADGVRQGYRGDSRTPSGVLYPAKWNLNLKDETLGRKIDSGVDVFETSFIKRIERYALLQIRLALAFGAIVGSGVGIKYTIDELSAPVPFEQFISSPRKDEAADDSSKTVETPAMSYVQVKALAVELNGKFLKQLVADMAEANTSGLMDTFSRDIVLQHKKSLVSTALTADQRSEVHASFLHAVIKEITKFNLTKNNGSASNGNSTSKS